LIIEEDLLLVRQSFIFVSFRLEVLFSHVSK
jgi:hypothetical protein